MSPIWWIIIALAVVGVGFLVYRRGPKTAWAAIVAFGMAIAAAVAELAGQFTIPPGV